MRLGPGCSKSELLVTQMDLFADYLAGERPFRNVNGWES